MASNNIQSKSPKVVYSEEKVAFRQLSYLVTKPTKKCILENIYGDFEPGTLTAIMGPSGAGKSTLLDILSERKSFGHVTGSLQLVGRSRTGYVEQFDTLVGELTVEEMLWYTAELLLPNLMNAKQRKERSELILEHLKLTHCRNVVIGSVHNRGISGGESKRLNIGIALLPLPKVLFLDEPTTGLDSNLANEVMLTIKDFVRARKAAVVAILHNPTALCFSTFDMLMLLSQNGKTIYYGKCNECKCYLENLGFWFPNDGRYSLIEWIVEVTSGSASLSLQEARARQSTDSTSPCTLQETIKIGDGLLSLLNPMEAQVDEKVEYGDVVEEYDDDDDVEAQINQRNLNDEEKTNEIYYDANDSDDDDSDDNDDSDDVDDDEDEIDININDNGGKKNETFFEQKWREYFITIEYLFVDVTGSFIDKPLPLSSSFFHSLFILLLFRGVRNVTSIRFGKQNKTK